LKRFIMKNDLRDHITAVHKKIKVSNPALLHLKKLILRYYNIYLVILVKNRAVIVLQLNAIL
jgi:hypothetical protein